MSEESYRVRDLQERVHRKQAENTRLTKELAQSEAKNNGYAVVTEALMKRRDGLIEELTASHSQISKLQEFAQYVIREQCWGVEMDGIELQDLAVNLGLLAEHIATEADVGEEDDIEVGDKMFKFTEALPTAPVSQPQEGDKSE